MSNVQCPVCSKEMRKDHLGRHMKTHKELINSIMTIAQVKWCKVNKYPILKTGCNPDNKEITTKCCHCLICGETTKPNTNIQMDVFLNTYKTKHSKCIKEFNSVEPYYFVADESITNDIVVEKPTVVSTVPHTEQFKIMCDQLKEINTNYEQLSADHIQSIEEAKEDCKRKNYAISVLDSLKSSIIGMLSEEQLKVHEALLNKCNLVINEEWDSLTDYNKEIEKKD